ncbi:CPBP family intramembrane metalloprotease [Collinsella sp. AGMB00827]|uniref:CPBP family intramembrane metalloprotease n=1 Tax=Collinsella ureilytica TaxID=2869515 RepID=A0ABS7MJ06_9ACTN|nr:CPBP family intramembrane glutamic endopeptidase [Collinsella urealyticum]MBY4797076.1 CPBP family intramembrane metalloprotease [Collinsella urealyticum]
MDERDQECTSVLQESREQTGAPRIPGAPVPPGTSLPTGKPIPQGVSVSQGVPVPSDTAQPSGAPVPPAAPIPSHIPMLPGTPVPPGASVPSDTPVARQPSRGIMPAIGWFMVALLMPIGLFVLMMVGAIAAFTAESFATNIDPNLLAVSPDLLLRADICGQLLVACVGVPIWLAIRRKTNVARRRTQRCKGAGLRTAGLILLAGLALQMLLSIALNWVLSFLPELAGEYMEHMEAAGVGEFSALSLLTVAILAPLIEEVACRGLMFEFLLRSFTALPWGRARVAAKQVVEPAMPEVAPTVEQGAAQRATLEPEDVRVSRPALIVAIVLQGLAFGAMHLNLVQIAYAFPMGVLLAWVLWQTGSLWACIGLHFAVNASSFLMEPLLGSMNGFTVALLLACAAAVFVYCIRALNSTALPVRDGSADSKATV